MRASLVTILLLIPVVGFAGPPSDSQTRVIGYFTEWTGVHPYLVQDIPADLLTHVNYAFAVIKDGRCALSDSVAATQTASVTDSPAADGHELRGHLRQLQLLKQAHPHLKTLVSIGGWGASGPFYEVASSDESRGRFARSCAEFVTRYAFDGVDIDWEFPGGGGADEAKGSPQDTPNFTLLLREIRRQLDEQGEADDKHYLLTIAAPAGKAHYSKIELDQIHPLLDFINLMAYDLAGSWSDGTGFNAPLFAPDAKTAADGLSVDAAVQAYLKAGVPPQKLVVGVPFYGHAFGGVADAGDGLGRPHDHKPPKPAGGGEWTYRVLSAAYVGKVGKRFWNETAQVPFLFDAASGLWISYDDPQSLRRKAEYVRDKKLGGVMIWELSQDDDSASLLKALNSGLERQPPAR